MLAQTAEQLVILLECRISQQCCLWMSTNYLVLLAIRSKLVQSAEYIVTAYQAGLRFRHAKARTTSQRDIPGCMWRFQP
jgi:hypothetical protein